MDLTVLKPTLPREPRSAISKTARSASSTISRASRPSGSSALDDDRVAGRDQLPQHRSLADDVRVGADVGGGRRVARQRAQVGQAADLIEQPLASRCPGQGHGIAGLIALDEAGDRLEDQPVIVAVEILRQHPIRDLVPCGGVEHQAAEHGLLGFDRVRRQAHAIAAGARSERLTAEAGGHVQSLRAAALPAATLRQRS